MAKRVPALFQLRQSKTYDEPPRLGMAITNQLHAQDPEPWQLVRGLYR